MNHEAIKKPKPIPLHRQIRCVKREIGKREKFYPDWVRGDRMTQAVADDEIATMKAVLETLQKHESFCGPQTLMF